MDQGLHNERATFGILSADQALDHLFSIGKDGIWSALLSRPRRDITFGDAKRGILKLRRETKHAVQQREPRDGRCTRALPESVVLYICQKDTAV